MNIEQIFAAEVFSARRNAAITRKHGLQQTEADQIEGALADLWRHNPAHAQEIAERHVEWIDDVPRARATGGDVVPIR